MNETLTLLYAHRSVRKFSPEPLPDEDIRKAVAAGQAASTSSAIQAYCVINVKDRRSRAELVALTGGQPYVAAAGAFLVICGDTRRHRLMCERAGRSYDARFEAMLLAAIDASLFAQNMAVAFESMGYGICFIGGLRLDLPAADRLLNIPRGVYPLYGMCVGRSDQEPAARPRLPVDAVLCEDAYPDDQTVLQSIDAYDETYRAFLRQRGVAADKIARGWSGVMSEKFATPRRTGVGPYYLSKGADLS